MRKAKNETTKEQKCRLDKENTGFEKAIENYKKAERAYYISAFLWILNIIVQLLANLDKIFLFVN